MKRQAAIIARHLTVQRQERIILNDLTFSVQQGAITGLLGPSGAGKTTLMRAIMGSQAIHAGELTVLGAAAGAASLRPRLGYVTQQPAVYTDLTVRQNIQYFARLLGKTSKDVDVTLAHVDLVKQADQLVADLSGGQRGRVSLGAALVGDAELLVLDEPTVGLDPVLRRQLWQLFRELAAQGKTLLISSHAMDEADQCDDLLLLRDGAVLSQGSRAALLRATHAPSVEDAFMQLVVDKAHA